MDIQYKWEGLSGLGRAQYRCGHCGNQVGPNAGYYARTSAAATAYVYICPACTRPTFIDVAGKQFPAVRFGNDVRGITDKPLETLYNQARDCLAVQAFTAAAMICRKILMHLAVENGAQPGESFVAYVDHLEKTGHVPPKGRAWVDKIRKKGNEANHEIRLIDQAEAEKLLSFTEMLLRFNYELPSLVGGNPP